MLELQAGLYGVRKKDRKSEEIAREAYILSLKLHINTILGPQLRNSYNNRVLPKYVAAHGKQPANRHVVRKEMLKEKTFKFWASFNNLYSFLISSCLSLLLILSILISKMLILSNNSPGDISDSIFLDLLAICVLN